ncbi:MAG: heparinase II/III family protein [Clostridia bacterium]|nr:heparinase II/III family protein [Clostridia bacterium]
MNKKIIMSLMPVVISFFFKVSVYGAEPNNSVTEDFEGCTSVDSLIDGNLFDSYTALKPSLESGGFGTDLVISSAGKSSNTLFMGSECFDRGRLSAALSLRADSAPKRNWGYASHIQIQYEDENKEVKSQVLAEFAYDLIRVKVDGKEVKAESFSSTRYYDFSFDINKVYVSGKYVIRVDYSINSQSYTCEFTACEDSVFCLGLSSFEGNALHVQQISKSVFPVQNELTSEDFSSYTDAAAFIPGRIFDMYTKEIPKLTAEKCLDIDSQDNSDNILLTVWENTDESGVRYNFEISADRTENKNWALAPKVILRYDKEDGNPKNESIIEFAYNYVRARKTSGFVNAVKFNTGSFYNIDVNINKEYKQGQYVFVVKCTVGNQEFTTEFTTCENGKAGIGFQSIYGNSVLLKSMNMYHSSRYYKPSREDIKQAFLNNCPDGKHPRIMMEDKRLSAIKSNINSDERVRAWYENVKAQANTALGKPVSKYKLEYGDRLLFVSRNVFSNAVYPAFVYIIEGEEKYKDRVWKELEAVSEFVDWHPSHFLDTAEMMFAFAICYDWLYDDWTEDQRNTIKNAIVNLGLNPASEAYNGTATYDKSVYGAYHNRIGWKSDLSNWGLVCNGGVAAGALAVMDSESIDFCADILYNAIQGLSKPMTLYSDDGAWIEGLGYWQYATNYFCYMMSSLRSTLGTTYGFLNTDGLRNTTKYLMGHTGTNASFNYGDCDEGVVSSAALFYLADALKQPEINAYRLSIMDRFGKGGDIFDIIFYNPAAGAGQSVIDNNLRFDSVGVVSSVSSHKNKMANYIAVKGGRIGVSHGDLDAGSFVIDALGERWANDYGGDLYTLDGYFDWAKRINYYRKRAEGHSAIVINPDGGADQKLNSEAKITDFISGLNGMAAVMDLSDVYSNNVQSAKRAVIAADDYSKFIVQDEIAANGPSDIYWFMQTGKKASVSEDGKTMVLSGDNGKRMLMALQSDCDTARFEVTDAVPLPVSLSPAGQDPNKGYKRICIKSADVESLLLRVTFIPYYEGFEPDTDSLSPLTDISGLIAASGDFNTSAVAHADGITLDGESISGFEKNIYYYNAASKNGYLPKIEVQSDYDVHIKYGAVTEITLTDPVGAVKDGKYYIVFSGVQNDTSLNVELKADGQSIDHLICGDVMVSAYYYAEEARIYIAQYGIDGALKRVVCGNSDVFTIDETDTIRIFVWDKDNRQKPFITAEEFFSEEIL